MASPAGPDPVGGPGMEQGLEPLAQHFVAGIDHHKRLRVGLADDLAHGGDLAAAHDREEHDALLARIASLSRQEGHAALQLLQDALPTWKSKRLSAPLPQATQRKTAPVAAGSGRSARRQ